MDDMTDRVDQRRGVEPPHGWRATRRRDAVNVFPELPDGTVQDGHIMGGHCRCLPTLETWTMGGKTTYRLAHRQLTQVEA